MAQRPRYPMKPKQIALVALIVVVASMLSALAAYRYALRPAPQGWSKVAALGASQPEAPQSGALQSGALPSGATSGCVDISDAGSHTSQEGCVSGRLLRAFTSRGGNTFLDFCQDYRKCPFTSVIFASDKNKFGDLSTLSGRLVEIHGTITSYQGRAEIIIHGPEQIHVLP